MTFSKHKTSSTPGGHVTALVAHACGVPGRAVRDLRVRPQADDAPPAAPTPVILAMAKPCMNWRREDP